MLRNTCLLLLLAVAVVSCFHGANDCRADDDKLSAFMRMKLNHSQKVMEGLATEDFAMIAKHSQAMSLLCEDENWSVLKTPEYQERSNEFRRTVDSMTEAAKQGNLEAAALAYVDTTMKCVSCHKYVRKNRMASSNAPVRR